MTDAAQGGDEADDPWRRGRPVSELRTLSLVLGGQGEAGAMRASASVLLLCFISSDVRAQSKSLFIEDMTWVEVRRALADGKTTALYLAGSTEEGGPHMVLGKHNILARYAAQRIAERLGNALIYPTMPFAPTGDPAKRDDLMEFPG